MIALDNLPGVAQVAIQGAKYAAKEINRRLDGQAAQAPVQVLRQGLDGHDLAASARSRWSASCGSPAFVAWLMWLAVHLVYITGFKNRVTALLHWAITFIGRGRSERAATEQQVFARQAISDLGSEFSPELPRVAEDRPHAAAVPSEPTSADAVPADPPPADPPPADGIPVEPATDASRAD